MSNKIDKNHGEVFNNIKRLMDNARNKVANEINSILLQTYWEIGRIIVEDEQGHLERAEYGKELINDLSRQLTKEYGKGFSKSNLFNMRNLYLSYPIFQTLSGKLTWSHYCELLSISDERKRSFYEQESINANWSVRELKRQIKTSLFERLLLSSGEGNKEKILDLALKGNEINSASDIVRDPYVFEFLGIPEEKPIMESDLEKALINHIEKFLLELGKGFMYVGSQQRITLGNTHYYVDMVFYNKILRSYVLIELKTSKLMPEAVGQLNMYLNYYKLEVNDDYDNEPIGIILCTDKDGVQAEYALGNLSNKIFASKYTLYIPNREELELQVEKVIQAYREK
ncbi:PDDEXK nuclease domain-containing protein [Lagierella massiliensis]|uniref:PDDEXK nuclease domain-containing protein n=1 Tax=Lagierella massiliensis TaxID=1689303 RepID=UPI0006D85828|nr:PDDEXK nuclease domain-containing protein [Lagierella massiliensis]